MNPRPMNLRPINKISAVLLSSGLAVAAAAGCGQDPIGEGEAEPAAVLTPSADGKDGSLAALGVSSQHRSESGNVNLLAGRIPVGSGSLDELRALIAGRLASVYRLPPGTDFGLLGEQTDARGQRFVRLQQLHDGVPVAGGQLAVLLAPDGATLLALLGELAPEARAQAVRSDGESVVRAAVARLGSDVTLHTSPSAALFLAPGSPRGTAPRMAFRAIVEWSDAATTARALEQVFVAMDDGQVLGRYTLIHSALRRSLYDLGQTCIKSGRELPGRALFQEGGTSSDTAATAAYDGTGTTYWFYKHVFGRDSYDNQGAPLVSSVHGQFDGGTSCSPNNAVWLGYPYNQMAFGDGDGRILTNLAKGLDVTAHELSHAVTGVTSKLVYSGESGALNEAMSDILGVTAATWKRAGGGPAGGPATFGADDRTWLVGAEVAGPQLAGGALRFMNNPTRDGYSADFYPERITGTADNGGVHGNSGIANLAFYLLSQGGTHPRGKTSTVVSGIGLVRAARIFYTANTALLTESATFEAARNATAQAAQTLFGACSPEWQSTHRAWDAVGVPGAWSPCMGSGEPTPTPTPSMTVQREVKPSSSFATANVVKLPGTTVQGYLADSRDTSYFKLTLPAGATLTARLEVPRTSDFDLYIYNSNGTLIAKSENGTGLAEEAKVVNTSTQAFTRYVRVTYYSGAVGEAAPYALRLGW
jgi:Zn-dependent metalloprotease